VSTLVLSTPVFADDTDMIAACTQTVYNYAWYLDHPDDDHDVAKVKYLSLFTNDAVLNLLNPQLKRETFTGPEEIAARYTAHRGSSLGLHLMTNVRIKQTSKNTATGTNYLELYTHPVNGSLTESGGIKAVGEYRDEYRFDNGICLISKRYLILRLLNLKNVITVPKP
jgi:hypothetical protein